MWENSELWRAWENAARWLRGTHYAAQKVGVAPKAEASISMVAVVGVVGERDGRRRSTSWWILWKRALEAMLAVSSWKFDGWL